MSYAYDAMYDRNVRMYEINYKLTDLHRLLATVHRTRYDATCEQ